MKDTPCGAWHDRKRNTRQPTVLLLAGSLSRSYCCRVPVCKFLLRESPSRMVVMQSSRCCRKAAAGGEVVSAGMASLFLLRRGACAGDWECILQSLARTLIISMCSFGCKVTKILSKMKGKHKNFYNLLFCRLTTTNNRRDGICGLYLNNFDKTCILGLCEWRISELKVRRPQIREF